MGFYSRWVFPRLCHHALSEERIGRLRGELLAAARGRVLEIGSGTGLNLPHYPAAVRALTAADPNPGMHRLARRHAEPPPFPVDLDLAKAEDLPYEDASFDTVVSTWTLCSIDGVEAALAQVARVLVPGGRFLFIEHGASPEPGVRRWQRRLTPLQKRIGDGCRLTRDIEALVAASPLAVERCERFYMPRTPKVAGYTYRGAAVKASPSGTEATAPAAAPRSAGR